MVMDGVWTRVGGGTRGRGDGTARVVVRTGARAVVDRPALARPVGVVCRGVVYGRRGGGATLAGRRVGRAAGVDRDGVAAVFIVWVRCGGE